MHPNQLQLSHLQDSDSNSKELEQWSKCRTARRAVGSICTSNQLQLIHLQDTATTAARGLTDCLGARLQGMLLLGSALQSSATSADSMARGKPNQPLANLRRDHAHPSDETQSQISMTVMFGSTLSYDTAFAAFSYW
jgi:hypothetical protein